MGYRKLVVSNKEYDKSPAEKERGDTSEWCGKKGAASNSNNLVAGGVDLGVPGSED